MTMDAIPRSWSKEEVAKAWGISPKAIDRLIRDGKVGYYKAGRSRRFFEEHVQQIRAALEQAPWAAEPRTLGPGELRGLTSRSAARRRSSWLNSLSDATDD